MYALSSLLRPRPRAEESESTVDLLRRTPLDELDRTVAALKQVRPAAEVRAAMVEVIARAPLSDFAALKEIYLRHCADEAR